MTDESLREEILTILTSDRHTASAEFRVGVLSGIAHLAGTTDSMATRAAAEELAGSVPGVRGVVNRIEAPGAPSPSRIVQLNLSQDERDKD